MNTDFVLPRGYERLEADCRRFFVDHPAYDRNVFIMTRFEPGNRLLTRLDEELRKALCRQRLTGIRADDRVYPRDRDLWDNVCVHMLCCSLGVAVLEDRVQNEFNPNVALEYGFMRALDKPVLLLVDSGFRNLRADVIGTVREAFDIADPDLAGTLTEPIGNWVRDLGQALPQAGPGALRQQAMGTCRRLLNIRCAQLIADRHRRQREFDDELWYLGRDEIAPYRILLSQTPDAAHEAAVELAEQTILHHHDLTQIDALIDRFAQLAAAQSAGGTRRD